MSKVRSMSPRSDVSYGESHQLHASDEEEEEEEEEEAREVEDEHLREQTRGRERHKSHHHHHHHHKSRSRSVSKHSPRKHSKGSKNTSSSSKHRPHHDKHHHSSSSSRKKVTQHDSPEAHSLSQKSQSSPLKGKAKEKAFLKNMNVPESEGEEDEGEKNDSQDNNSLLNHSLQSESEVEVNHASTSKSTKKKGKNTKGKKPLKKKRKTGTHGWSKMSHSKHVKKREPSSSPPTSSEEELVVLGEYIPEKIVDGGIRKKADGTTYHMFKVRWKGYKPKDDTWEPEEHLKDRKDLIEAYMDKIGKTKKTGTAKSKLAKPKKSNLPPLDMVNSEEEEEEEEAMRERNKVREAEEAFSGNEQGGTREGSPNHVTPSAHDSNSGSEQEKDEDETVKRFADEHLKGKSWQKHLIEVKAIRTRNGEDEAHVVFDNGDEGWCPSDPIQERAPNVLIAYMRESMRRQK